MNLHTSIAELIADEIMTNDDDVIIAPINDNFYSVRLRSSNRRKRVNINIDYVTLTNNFNNAVYSLKKITGE